ncbi:hypothetical protein GYMLUDRAFT_246474 [Collybiopsis luxurians FD-317 M1]|uniref:Uncharacterized protein n=1 Tax=Collybiopsis luxurians FD-317 M1 TaxID=944289 RepID=A0A0D0C6H2_9AGAR|nr:hypothetical protein GYMLUDRAFT_246474 [Collybiopsis luxurians FD-317 M1]
MPAGHGIGYKAHVPGNGHKFKAPVLNAAAAHMNQHLIKGGAKKAKGIKDKVRDLLAIDDAVVDLKTQVSGLHWDDSLGMNIELEEEEIWGRIIAKHPNCTPFNQQGIINPAPASSPMESHIIPQSSSDTAPASPSGIHPASSSSDIPSTSPRCQISPDWNEAQLEADMTQSSDAQSQSALSLSSDSQITLSLAPVSTPVTQSWKCPAPTSIPSVSKRSKPTSSNAVAMFGLAGALNCFGKRFSHGTQTLAAAINAIFEWAVCTKQAQDILEEKETWLTCHQKIRLGKKFVDARKADSYIYFSGLSSPDQKAWVSEELDISDPFFEDF